MSWMIPYCDGCHITHPVMVILKDELWDSICNHPAELLCFTCIEFRLGRPLTFADLKERTGITEEMRLGAKIYEQTADKAEAKLWLAGHTTVYHERLANVQERLTKSEKVTCIDGEGKIHYSGGEGPDKGTVRGNRSHPGCSRPRG